MIIRLSGPAKRRQDSRHPHRSDTAWEAVDAKMARARFTHGGQTIAATLRFDSEGQLINFVSDDRSRSESDGTITPRRFSTPARGYGEFNLVEVTYNVGASP